MRLRARLSLAALLCLTVFGQTSETALRFEVADVHSSPHRSVPVAMGPFYTSGRYELRFASMLDLIAKAYNVDTESVFGGPSWLELDRFDVFAKTRAASAEARRVMLQSLLAERFDLVVHRDSKPVEAFALTAGKHSELKPSAEEGPGGCSFIVQNAPSGPPPPGAPLKLPVIVYTCKNTTMEAFAAALGAVPGGGQYLNNKMVVDRTGIQGSWDFSFRYTPKVPAGIQTMDESMPLPDAVEKQLGLKLELSTAPAPVIVVDRVNRKPTANSPEAMKSFPPLPTEFEVASLKPSPPDSGGGRGGPSMPNIRNGRLYLPRITVKNLIAIAWDINGDEFLVNAPKWLDDDRYDLLAKAPEGVAIGDLTPQRGGISVNIEALRPMLRSLVTERFQLKVHMEGRPMNAYNLVAVKPKLKRADPASRTRWKEGTATSTADGKNANPSLGRLVTCQNVTMAEFAAMLPNIAPGYLRTNVVDATGLEGGWDFTFSFSPAGALNFGRGGPRGDAPAPDSGAVPEASEPTGAMSLFDALTHQLGLKLELQKRPAPVLVIDHIERTPTEN
ncbi:MAG TPA: TIGR03435 family protein [Bryobacteraceae bacterium]|nr:TIGR03435 family protein [Bryobacteraceae bacterium]